MIADCATQADVDAAIAAGHAVAVTQGTFFVGGPATVHAFGAATVHAADSVIVHAFGAATVHASDSATVHAFGAATVHAFGAATVHAWGSATVHAADSVTVHAADSVAIHQKSEHCTINGGVVIRPPTAQGMVENPGKEAEQDLTAARSVVEFSSTASTFAAPASASQARPMSGATDAPSIMPVELDDAQVAHALREHRQAQRAIDELAARKAAEVAEIELAHRDEAQRLGTAVRYWEDRLVAHATAVKERTGAKSQKWPSATIRSTTRTGVAYDDEDALTLWLAAGFPDFVRTRCEVDKAKVRASVHFTDDGNAWLDGEPVPGIRQTTTTTWTIRHGAPAHEGTDA